MTTTLRNLGTTLFKEGTALKKEIKFPGCIYTSKLQKEKLKHIIKASF